LDAYIKVESMTQAKLGSTAAGKDLWSQGFSLEDPTDKSDRLRLSGIDKDQQPDRWKSAHEGAGSLGRACAQMIRNGVAHSLEPLEEQLALEYVATISVLARLVDDCEVLIHESTS